MQTQTVAYKKGDKTDSILRFLEENGPSEPLAIAHVTQLSTKEISSRVCTLVAQGRVERVGGGRGQKVSIRFVGWDIRHSRVTEPVRPVEVPLLDRLWNGGMAEQLLALADAVAGGPVAPKPAPVLGAPASAFVQVLLKAQAEGRMQVKTHCMIDDDDFELPKPRRRAKVVPVAPVPALPAVAVGESYPLPLVSLAEVPKRFRAAVAAYPAAIAA